MYNNTMLIIYFYFYELFRIKLTLEWSRSVNKTIIRFLIHSS